MADLSPRCSQKKPPIRNLFTTPLANSLNKQVYSTSLITLWVALRRYFCIQTIGLTTFGTFEMNMIMVMSCGCTGFIAERILQTSFIIKHFMNKSFVQKGFKSSVNGYAIE